MEEKLGLVMRRFASWMSNCSCWSSFPEFLPSDEKSTEETRQRKRCLSASAPYTPTSCVCACVCVCVIKDKGHIMLLPNYALQKLWMCTSAVIIHKKIPKCFFFIDL